MSSNAPIGIFDSGVGGTSIWKEIHRMLPREESIYLADSKNTPYGTKPKQAILSLSKKNTEKLLSFGCKIIVVACNTATTNAINELRETYNVPFIGIEPAIKPAALNSKTKAIGILATKGTLSSALFYKTSELYAKQIKIIEVEGNGLVERIEAGKIHSLETYRFLQTMLKPMLQNKIDYLVLGCSHYPYLLPVLQQILPPQVQIIDSGEAVARQTKAILFKNDLLNESETAAQKPQFHTNGNVQVLKELLQAEKNNYKVSRLDF